MIEVIAFVAFGIALAALLNGRKTAERLETEIAALKEELKRIEELRPALSAAAGTERAAQSEPAESQQAVRTATVERKRLAEISKGDAIFGGPPPSQDIVEKASRGEPVAARSAPASVIDAVAPRPKESLESRLGARWAVWVGGIALALGGVFMVKYSIDAGLLSPAVRLLMAAIFGLLLMGIGELVRRRAVPLVADTFQNAMIPGILTAAGAVTLFGVCYAAHGIYGFIGPAAAFALLALVSLATVGLSLLHGQALAGLGLLASLVTPALVSSESPSPWSLFGFLAIAWSATLLAARIRRWAIVPSLANIGLCLWALAYIASATPFETLPVTLVMLVMIAGVGFIWPGRIADAAAADLPGAVGGQRSALPRTSWDHVMAPPLAAITVTTGISTLLTALAMISPIAAASDYPVAVFCVVVSALAGLGALRGYAVYPALLAAFIAIAGLWSITALSGLLIFIDPAFPGAIATIAVSGRTAMLASMALSSVFIALGALANRLHLIDHPPLATLWAAIMAIVPFALTGMSLLMTGNLSFDLPHGLFSLTAGIVLLGLAEWLPRRDVPQENIALPQMFVVAGSLGLFVIALHALTEGLATTTLIASLGVPMSRQHVCALGRRCPG